MQDNNTYLYQQKRELTPSELVRKHIQDPTHVVTDEELKNVKLVLDSPVNVDNHENKDN
jgi:hypothetical protein